VGNYPIFDIAILNNDFYGSPFGIRTGYYPGAGTSGSVYNIAITGNDIHNLVPGKAFPNGGNAVDIGGFGARAPISNIMVKLNSVCQAGAIIVAPGKGDSVTQNSTC
jgi:hypothetical protein